MTAINSITLHRIAAIERALTAGDKTLHQITAEIHIHVDRARKHVFLMLELGKLHIRRFAPFALDNDYPIAVYRLGAGRNAKKPAPRTGAQKQAKARKRTQADADKRELRNSRKRARRRIQAATSAPSTWMSALPGASRTQGGAP
jgi:hypothetical protein